MTKPAGPRAHTERLNNGWAIIWNEDHPDRRKIVPAPSYCRYGLLNGFSSEADALSAYDSCYPPVFEKRRARKG
jgi:hypothetical protein